MSESALLTIPPPEQEPEPVSPTRAPEPPPAQPMVRLKALLWPLALSVVALGLIAWFTLEAGTMTRLAESLNPWIMALAVVSLGIRIFFGGWRITHASDGRLGMAAGLRAQLAWDFASNLTPSVVGGAPLAAVYVSRESRKGGEPGVSVGRVSAFMVYVMLLDQCWFAITAPLILIAAAFIPVIPESLGEFGLITTVAYLLIFMAWTAVFGYGTLFRPDLLQRLMERVFTFRLLRRFRTRVVSEMEDYSERAAAIRKKPLGFFVRGLLLTAGTWAGRYLMIVFIIWSVVPELDIFLATMRSVALTVGSLVMPTPGGAGGIEGLYLLFMSSLMPKSFVVPTLLVWRLLAYYIFVAFGIALSTHHFGVRGESTRP